MKKVFKSLEVIHKTNQRVRFVFAPETSINFEEIKRYLDVIDGVKSVRFNLNAKSLIIEHERLNLDDLKQKLENLTVEDVNLNSNLEFKEEPNLPLLKPLIGLLSANSKFEPFVLPITLYSTYGNVLNGLKSLFKNGIDSEVLESLAIAISIYRKDYFSANTTNFLLELSEYIEEQIERKSDSMLKTLLTPDIKQVWIEKDKEEILIDYKELKKGDIVVLNGGNIVSIDGTVIGGEALVDESSITGEAVYVKKSRGDRVVSGTTLKEGRVRVWAENIGEQSAVYRISSYVQNSLEAKSKAQIDASILADKLAPITLGLALFSYIVSKDFGRVASVFQADYSCALKLATPVAFKSSLFKAGKMGALIKGADVLERLSEIDTVVFDKTGTLSSGNLKVRDVFCMNNEWSKDEVLSLAASIEEHYFHPIAEAVVKAANSLTNHEHFHHSEVEFIVAHGVSANVNNKKVLIGSRHFLEEDEGICFKLSENLIENEFQKGRILLYIAYDGELLGVISLSDEIRDESEKTIERLRELGVKEIIMLSGDAKNKAKEISDKLKLDKFYGELMPEDKSKIVENLKKDGKKVAFIGDGINDAPALSISHVGIAMQKGADIAKVSADIALLEDNLFLIAKLKELANKSVKLVNQNYHLILILNSIILGSATMGLINSTTTSILHNGTTIGILLNSLKGVR